MTELLKPGYEIITNHEMLHECDGMNRVIDMQWARYLLTFDHDHFDVIGFNPNIYPIHVASLITDNMRLAEAKSGDKDHEKFEVFDLPTKEHQKKTSKSKQRIELRKI